jgi:hypothetical protein
LVVVDRLFLTGTPQRVGRIRGADINADLRYLIISQYTTGGLSVIILSTISSVAALTEDF